MGSKGSQTTTQNTTSAPDQNAYNAYLSILQRAQGVGSQPYTPYSGELVAGVNQQQNLGIGGINQYANAAQPSINQALTQTQASSAPLSAAGIQNYMSPYTQNVVNATQAQFDKSNAQALNQVKGNAVAQGALGGNREAVAESQTLGNLQPAQAQTIAGLYNTGYQNAVNTAQQQQQIGLQGAGQLGSLGIAGQTAGLQGAGQQIGAGTLQQQTQQAQDQAAYQQWQNQQAYPYQQLQWLAGLSTGVGSQMGGTSSGQTTAPAANPWSSILGAATSGIGMLGSLGVFSDERVKENIKEVGTTHDGQRIYRFNYKGDPTTHIGLIAQEVEKKHPEAVGVAHGVKTVDYKEATDDAVRHRAAGGGIAQSPFGDAQGYIPQMNITHGSGAPRASAPQPYQDKSADPSKMAASIGDLAKTIKTNMSGPAWGGGSFLSGDAWGGSSSNPIEGLSASDYGEGFKRGGVVRADGGSVDDDPGIGERIARAMHEGRNHGQRAFYNQTRAGLYRSETAPNEGYTYGGLGHGLDTRRRLQMMDAQDIEDKVRGFADGGSPQFDDRFDASFGGYGGDDSTPNFKDRFPEVNNSWGEGITSIGKADDYPVGSRFNPYRMADPDAVEDWRNGIKHPNDALIADTSPNGPVKSRGVTPPDEEPTTALAYSGTGNARNRSLPSEISSGRSNSVVPPSERDTEGADAAEKDSRWGANSKLWPSLISAGFGMMASRSPNLGNAIGEGGMAGIRSYNDQQEAAYKARQDEIKNQRDQEREERAMRQEERQNAISSIIPDGTGGYKINPLYIQLKQQESDIATKDRWAPIGNVVSGGQSHPLVLNAADGRILDAVTGKPPQQGDVVNTNVRGKSGADPADIMKIGDGIISGRQPPTLSGLYGNSAAVRAYLEEKNFDLSKAQMESDAAKKQIATLNGPQMVRFVGLAKSVSSTIDEVRELSKELQNSGVPLMNRAKMQVYMQTMGNTPQGQLVARYMGAVNTLKEEFANLANGGYAPTEAAWKLAHDQINGDYGVQQLGASLDEVQRLIHYRVNAIPGLNTLGPGATNRYTGQKGEPLLEDKGHGAVTPQGTTKPTLDQFLEKAHAANPNASRQQLIDYYNKKYGG